MASFTEHLGQARHNCSFLNFLENNTEEYYDWKVTVCFYITIHLINARIADRDNAHYRKHRDVENAINPYNGSCAIPENVFLSYKKLHNLSRRSRYLIHEDNHRHIEGEKAHYTSEKHFKKAKNRLQEIKDYFLADHKIAVDVNKPVTEVKKEC